MTKYKTYKTRNFSKLTSWLKRTFFVSLFGFIIFYRILQYAELSTLQNIIFLSILFILVVIGQIDELEINQNEIIIEQKSFIPFFNSKRTYALSEIKLIRKNSNYVEGDGSWIVLIFRKKKAVELIFNDGKSEVINANLHPFGYKGLVNEIKKRNEFQKNE